MGVYTLKVHCRYLTNQSSDSLQVNYILYSQKIWWFGDPFPTAKFSPTKRFAIRRYLWIVAQASQLPITEEKRA